MKTEENLMAAFAGESQANRKYLAFAKQAEKEGKKGLAKLFRVAAEGETIHAIKHFENAGKVKTSKENMEAAIAGETYEFTQMYPEFIKQAEQDEKKAAILGFMGANAVEQDHAKLFQKALEADGDIEEKEYYICSICGHPHVGEAPEMCPVCKAPKSQFYKF